VGGCPGVGAPDPWGLRGGPGLGFGAPNPVARSARSTNREVIPGSILRFVAIVWFVTLGFALTARAEDQSPHQTTGTRVGEVTESSAILWTRLTAHPNRVVQDSARPGESEVDRLEGACPGAAGRVRVRLATRADLSDAVATEWVDVGPANDSIHQFPLTGLKPSTVYHYEVETSGPGGSPRHGGFQGTFQTADPPEARTDLRFCVMTCQGYHDRGHPDGHAIYPAMRALKPRFVALTGDLVYYDNDEPRAVNARLARYHWERMFSLPRLVEFQREVAAYWLKDDHDTLNNDSWPGARMGDFTFAQGQAIFRQQAPTADGPPYRTFRHGRDLQIWLTDGRDFRSPNRMPDGPDKTIWGAEQKAWFFRTMKASDATWKVLISPTPLVGPDRVGKNDNHANAGFQSEGDEIRGWLRGNAPDDAFVICGDRHWQYHSVHPQTGLNEFGVGAASDEHAGGTPGENKTYHRFHRPKGGFLSVTVRPDGPSSVIRFEHRDTTGNVVYSWERRRTPASGPE
ncbi:MAG: alkaline phosphatase, partial [Isosphaeraceae bacterium]